MKTTGTTWTSAIAHTACVWACVYNTTCRLYMQYLTKRLMIGREYVHELRSIV